MWKIVMLEFIVLGLVPGTKIQLTLTGVLILALAICVGALLYVEKPRMRALLDRLHKPAEGNELAA